MTEHIYFGHDTTEESLAAQLPEFMPKDPESGNYKLLSTIADRLDAHDDDIDTIDKANTVQTAETMDQLERLALLVDLTPYQNETLEHFRKRVLAEFQIVTSTATVSDVINGAATILGVGIESISYTEEHTTEAGNAQLEIPFSKLDKLALTESEFLSAVEKLMPASYQLSILDTGTFTYITPSAYNSGNHDATLGYDGLDTNGNPKNNGGTYAGVL